MYLGVRNGRGDPVSVFLIIPILGLRGFWVRNGKGLIFQPVLWDGSLLVDNLEWRILIPVLWLLGLWVGNSDGVNPILRLLVFRIINLLGWVESGGEVLEKVGLLDLLAIQLNDGGVIRVDDEGVELSGLDNSGGGGRLQVLLLIFASLGVLVVDDQVNLVGGTALVGTEHDNVRGDVRELILVESLVITEELQVSTTTLETICRTISESLEPKEKFGAHFEA